MRATTSFTAQNDASICWETVACPLCGAWNAEEILTQRAPTGKDLYRLVRCRACTMGYLNPRPDRSSIGQFYPDDYGPYQARVRHRHHWWDRLRRHLIGLVLSHRYNYPPPLEHWHQKLLATVAGPWFGPGRHSMTDLAFHGEGRLLDFGCGSGWFAHRMRERGWQVTGTDFSEHSARQAREHYGIQVHVGSLPHPAIKPQSFDVITMGAVLEHVHDPHQTVAAAIEALRPGGRLVISVPNLASWGFRHYGCDWWGLELPRHLLHFTPATLRQLAERHGLRVRALSTQVRKGWLRRSEANVRRRGAASSRGLLGKLIGTSIGTSLAACRADLTGDADSLRLIAERPVFTSAPQTWRRPSD